MEREPLPVIFHLIHSFLSVGCCDEVHPEGGGTQEQVSQGGGGPIPRDIQGPA